MTGRARFYGKDHELAVVLRYDKRRQAKELADELHSAILSGSDRYAYCLFDCRGKKYRMVWVDMGKDQVARYEIETVQD